MKEILGDAKNIRALLSKEKYAIDYYQREYKWGTEQVMDLLDDLADRFLDSHDPGGERSAVKGYGRYFLGSIVISDRDNQKFIIDGQQRLTTLTLLLLHLHHLIEDGDYKSHIADLIFSLQYGKRSFNLDITERTACMDALYNGQPFDDTDQPESVRNILANYKYIGDQFPNELTGEALPYFVDWLIENVYLVEVRAYSDEDAYTIFETMNDRGLGLTSVEMLKGYLLANITDSDRRNEASKAWKAWKDRVAERQELGKKEEGDGIKAWLRSQHAESIRERTRGAKPQDFDLIGTEFHRWVRDHDKALGLRASVDFARLIEKDFTFYTRQYHQLRQAAKTLTTGLECIHYNAQNNFTLQYPVLLAPLRLDDSEDEILRKIRITAAYLDILIARRIWNFRSIAYSTMQYAMFLVMRDIRGMGPAELVEALGNRLAEEHETFVSNDHLRMHQQNRWGIHYLLARMTDHLEQAAGRPSHFMEYVTGSGKNRYEVEHIWADKPERHADDFPYPADFKEYRSRIGGLLLLPKSFNASYGSLPYGDKREHYFGQNLLAQSLHERAYDHQPGFVAYIKRSGLPFHKHPEFRRADLDDRQELYRRLAEEIWSPDRLSSEASQ